ncbi:MAG: integral membrane protein TerC [uncultured bacterium]|nr:MAG: integral membrane protein TerC [uncultured bacterium]OGN55332.1 MAG: hypothetical protein A2796_02220 [Chlamydiae bacterium RIFCSPHIGHO2_01_FULL_44_39]OGN57285.1 MAG: hypothetical protein A3C42_01125 [Chlamydiae bacterium RIFCSPHIGHO2_02_FULL_45_9]OGN59835.1 MAG: hypothetical protein A3D96_03535 [Chlamydiae bacterium RIFCSPHIGHO2_12_FULL_44_59]OGN66042.1 MAG: hypothetical protein A2978_04050 [Chlamydiae bacterium RIFCSPLOWO2_01_FULL_44_52]OGN68578.1 MAG: hypothetical protein A3I67_0237
MFDQSFTFLDIPRIFTLTFLELLLSADNAVVLGVLSHSLPQDQRKKALYIGIGSSFILRAGALFWIALVFESKWVQIVGGLYLNYLALRYLTQKKEPSKLRPHLSFWKVVALIELLDLVFALDSIVAGIAFINSDFSKLWLVYLGGMLGILGMRYAADLFSRMIDRFPRLQTSAYLMVGWIGVKLVLSAFHLFIPATLFWAVIVALFLLALLEKKE